MSLPSRSMWVVPQPRLGKFITQCADESDTQAINVMATAGLDWNGSACPRRHLPGSSLPWPACRKHCKHDPRRAQHNVEFVRASALRAVFSCVPQWQVKRQHNHQQQCTEYKNKQQANLSAGRAVAQKAVHQRYCKSAINCRAHSKKRGCSSSVPSTADAPNATEYKLGTVITQFLA